MAAKKITVVISQAQGKNPVKQQLEEDVAVALMMNPNIEISLVPHLYDMQHDHTGLIFLRSLPGDVVFLAWNYPRATRWILDRQNIKGKEGTSLLIDEDSEKESEDDNQSYSDAIGAVEVPNRNIYCINFKVSSNATDYIEEIERIYQECATQVVDLVPPKISTSQISTPQTPASNGEHQAYQNPLQIIEARKSSNISSESKTGNPALPEPTKRRWYPVIDYSRCTNCMECIDFCLFGVYGVDSLDRILVEEQDSCKKGCPACSRVCPANAIVFPGHKDSAIAGADGDVAGLKIDLSKLFGGGNDINVLDLAVKERDENLIASGRDAVGTSVGISNHLLNPEDGDKDEMDDLMDQLDSLEL
jgi:NAD-dependent dihydropyrimidine dehydrogenase PreA subunit